MTRFEKLLVSGVVLIFFGLLILSLGAEEAEGFFVIFPFIFVGNVSPLLAVSLLLFLVVVFYLSFKWVIPSTGKSVIPIDLVRIAMRCPFCEGLVPENAEYCPSCGNPLDWQSSD